MMLLSAATSRLASAASRAGARRALDQRQFARPFHIENKVHENMPFQYRNKRAFAFKITGFLGLGFSLPFFAVCFSQAKARGDFRPVMLGSC